MADDMDYNQLKISELVSRMYQRQRRGFAPYGLLLGAGASMACGCPGGKELIRKCTTRRNLPPNDQGDEQYYSYWSGLQPPERHAELAQHLILTKERPLPGYGDLVEPMAAHYFPHVVTFNFDEAIDTVLEEAGLASDAAFLVRGQEEAKIDRYLAPDNHQLVVVKPHGDIRQNHMVLAPHETFQFSGAVKQCLQTFLGRDLVICGYGNRDIDYLRVFGGEGGEIWYVNTDEGVTTCSRVAGPLGARAASIRGMSADSWKERAILDPELGKFSTFMGRLKSKLISKPDPFREVQ